MAYNTTHRRRIEAGLCVDCESPKDNETQTLRCDACRQRRVAAEKERKERYLAAGLCANCGIDPPKSKLYCERCLELNNERSRRANKRYRNRQKQLQRLGVVRLPAVNVYVD